MPPCGNFGLLLLHNEKPNETIKPVWKPPVDKDNKVAIQCEQKKFESSTDLIIQKESNFKCDEEDTYVSNDKSEWSTETDALWNTDTEERTELLSLTKILQAQTACTEVRGGQAGGISCLQFNSKKENPSNCRVRFVARKRYPLAKDLVDLFRKQKGNDPLENSDFTFCCHTRFATSSVNIVSELHPHEWVKVHKEFVWSINHASGKFERSLRDVVIHISHNGDFDALRSYGQVIVNEELGLWLERVLHTPNSTKGDSPKIAGMMDLFRVQGRWGAAARLAYVRAILYSTTDVSDGSQLTKTADNSFPLDSTWDHWAQFFEQTWSEHVNNVIKVLPVANCVNEKHYKIDRKGENLLIKALIESKSSRPSDSTAWANEVFKAFVSIAVRMFLRSDLYNSLTEFLSRAEGSFGLQVHCSLEPGVFVIASKGQPMSISYHPSLPICLFGSEGEAVAVPIDKNGNRLPYRIDLDSHGEIVRAGRPRHLLEGQYAGIQRDQQQRYLLLRSGIEIRAYSLDSATEDTDINLMRRSISLGQSSAKGESSDIVANDLKDIPAVLKRIEQAWASNVSPEYIAAKSLGEMLIDCMRARMALNTDTTDLLIGGVEASLWVAEQVATDLRHTFPKLNVHTVSTNKLMGYSDSHSSGKIIDSGTPYCICERTCVLIISQSGQTFPSLHATRKIASVVKDRLWILTGCHNSKMELAVKNSYATFNSSYGGNRFFYNYAGNRPAEPTSVAIVATMHTLTQLLLFLATQVNIENAASKRSKKMNPLSLLTPPGDFSGKIVLGPIVGDLRIPMSFTDYCLGDVNNMAKSLITNCSEIVGYDTNGSEISDKKVYRELVKQGKRWGEHVSEPWKITVAVGVYIVISVGFGLPLFGLIARAVVAIIQTKFENFKGGLVFGPLVIDTIRSQNEGWTIIGCIIQLIDAAWFVFLPKVFTWAMRLYQGRPIWARHGKRTVVVVDTPCVHQLVEVFASKLFSQSYSFVGLDVHGANGLDHFVHRFTHRVVRGVLLAVGRPDGRLSSLAKSESAVILAAKQAAFIQNPYYIGDSSGPDFITIGHNPFQPSMGLASHVCLRSDNRGKFVDEILYDRLHEASVPVTGTVLRSISPRVNGEKPGQGIYAQMYGTQFVDANIHNLQDSLSALFVDTKKFLHAMKMVAAKGNFDEHIVDKRSDNPAARVAFCHKLDSIAQEIQDSSAHLQQFYETRVASVERYVAFCVMFHALASSVNRPWLCFPWDISRSQSNLRVATTAAPVPAGDGEGGEMPAFVKKIAKKLGTNLSGFSLNF